MPCRRQPPDHGPGDVRARVLLSTERQSRVLLCRTDEPVAEIVPNTQPLTRPSASFGLVRRSSAASQLASARLPLRLARCNGWNGLTLDLVATLSTTVRGRSRFRSNFRTRSAQLRRNVICAVMRHTVQVRRGFWVLFPENRLLTAKPSEKILSWAPCDRGSASRGARRACGPIHAWKSGSLLVPDARVS
jgi:antitoxin (DNA-binding transcriptional repressor) of toxin-antitoxin stability system